MTNVKFKIPKEVENVSRVLSAAKFENYLVGGCVRDLILGTTPKDWDITTKANPEEIVALFEHTFYENDFGTVGIVHETPSTEAVRVVEVTPYRTESAYTDFRRPDEVKWAKTLAEDLKRRDFTVNALALKLNNESGIMNQELMDLFDGVGDIKKKLIRTVGLPLERFSEDALRMFRALRLASELSFAIESDTLLAIEKHKDLLAHISKERIRDEFTKIIMSPAPSIALGLATQLGLLKFISPELEKGIGMEQNKAHAFTVWEHLLRTLDHSAKKEFPIHVRLTALFHDIAKPHTRRWLNDQWTFYGHDVVGARIARNILTDLRFSKEIIEKVIKLVRWHMFFSETETITLSAVRRIVRNVGPELIWDLMDVRACDRVGTGRPKETTYRLRKYHSMIEEVMRDPISVKQLNINGADIMKLTEAPAGPHVGYILEILLAEVLEDPTKNDRKHLEARVLALMTLPPKDLEKEGKEARAKNEGEDEKKVEEIKEKYRVE